MMLEHTGNIGQRTAQVKLVGPVLAALEGPSEMLIARPISNDASTQQRAAATAEANAEKYFTQFDPTAPGRLDALHTQNDITRVEKHKRMAKVVFEGKKEELEGNLFDMFRLKEHWHLKDVAVRTPSVCLLADYQIPCGVAHPIVLHFVSAGSMCVKRTPEDTPHVTLCSSIKNWGGCVDGCTVCRRGWS
jgi:hypothetical protein